MGVTLSTGSIAWRSRRRCGLPATPARQIGHAQRDEDMSTAASRLPRVRAELRVAFARAGRRTQAARVYETGGWRLRFPRAAGCEAVVVNTGGGMAGGDEVAMMISAE